MAGYLLAVVVSFSFSRKSTNLFYTHYSRWLHNEELHALYRSRIVVRVIKSRWAGHVGRNAFKILTATPARKRPLGRPRHRLEDNIAKDLKEIGVISMTY